MDGHILIPVFVCLFIYIFLEFSNYYIEFMKEGDYFGEVEKEKGTERKAVRETACNLEEKKSGKVYKYSAYDGSLWSFDSWRKAEQSKKE